MLERKTENLIWLYLINSIESFLLQVTRASYFNQALTPYARKFPHFFTYKIKIRNFLNTHIT